MSNPGQSIGGSGDEEPIAIVSYGGVFPGARDLDAFWKIVELGIDTSKAAPIERWILSPAQIQNPTPGTADCVYTDRGCFVDDFELRLSGLNISEELVKALDPAFAFALEAGRSAFLGARMDATDRSRIGIVLGNIALPTDASSKLCEQLLTPVLESMASGRSQKPAALGAFAFNRHVSGLPAGVLAQALGLGGGSSTLDAACASSLYALKLACDELRSGRADAMLVGGMSRPDSLYTQMGFCQLRALGRSGRCAPFDASSSGLIVGEGAAVVALKRLDTALGDGDTIHALIRGIGLSNDLDGNLLSPSSEGQLRALKTAYRQAGWTPDQVDMIECHATGTPVGDAVEFESLLQLWKDRPWHSGQCVLGAVKANIGHLLTASGGAGLIKILLALKHNILPATANFNQAKIPLAGSPFQVLQESRPWNRRHPGTPRRAAINGFGFGGINAHVLIEEWTGQIEPKHPSAKPSQPPVAVAIVGMAASVGRWPNLRKFQERVLGGGGEELPSEHRSWRNVPSDQLRAVFGVTGRLFPGYYLDDLSIPVNRYRIPPKELSELLPQQALMLEAARSALADARAAKTEPERTGVFVGLGLDMRTTDFHLRWSTLEGAGESASDSAGPALTADRTMGALAGINASRIAKEFHFGGPSHTVCSEDCSGIRALEIAVRALQRGELDQALAGAVDIAGDLRTLMATDAIRPYSRRGEAKPFDVNADGAVPGEGAVALVLKRLDDALRDGDRVYAVIRGVGSARGGGIQNICSPDGCRMALERAYAEAGVDPASVGYLESSGSGRPDEDRMEAAVLSAFFGADNRASACHLGSAKADVGHTGAASGLVSLAKAALALYQEIIPPLRGLTQPVAELAGNARMTAPSFPQHWIRNRVEGPRRAGVNSLSVDGNAMHVVLESCEGQTNGRMAAERNQHFETRSEALFTFKAQSPEGLIAQLDGLQAMTASPDNGSVEVLARRWWNLHTASGTARNEIEHSLPPGDASPECHLAMVAKDEEQLLRLLAEAKDMVSQRTSSSNDSPAWNRDRDRIFYCPPERRLRGGMAFVFPGSGSHFEEMGRELALHWPEILRGQDRDNLRLAAQMYSDRFWNSLSDGVVDHRALICGQVTLGAMVSDLAVSFGIRPEAVIGYSLGEATGLFALKAWTARDEMLSRVSASTLFTQDLTGKPEPLQRLWQLPHGQAAEWKAGLVDRSAEAVRKAMEGRQRVYVLIVNTPNECVIGGNADDLLALVEQLGCHWFPLEGVSTVHCELLKPFENQYRDLHLFDTTPPEGVRFYSGGWGRSYVPDRETAADAIVAQAGGCIDFPKVIRAAYDSGIRFFLELGPGNSCCRMIAQILEGLPHWTRSLCASTQEPLVGVLRSVGHLASEGIAVDLSGLYGQPLPQEACNPPSKEAIKQVIIAIDGPPFKTGLTIRRALEMPQSGPEIGLSLDAGLPVDAFEGQLLTAMTKAQSATVQAHQTYLNLSRSLFDTLSQSVQSQLGMIATMAAADPGPAGTLWPEAAQAQPAPPAAKRPVFLDRADCVEFARGSIAKVLGPQFSEADSFPTRVRLPDEPLMLVDRILEIHGEPLSMTHGRVVTEHDIHPNAWYLDCGRIPTCIAVEAGQADLFLSGYLGIDFQTRGHAVYRLLDAKVTFHCSLPGPGSVIDYDIRIDRFFRQGSIWLFQFSFEATVNGQPLLTMTDGCAGFFTAADLASGRGIVRTTMALKPMPGKRPDNWEEFVPMGVESYSAEQLSALREGDLAACFGPRFALMSLQRPLTLPSGKMRLVDRIPHLDPKGGHYGMGLIRGEADIHPKDWFLTCHFVDDPVMPGTLMFECCLHTLRVFLLRMGWVVEQGQAVLEPVPGIAGQLKCRGQVLETSSTITYEVTIKELGYNPEPYVIADALMYADGKPIVEITNMSLRYSGVTREALRQTWSALPRVKRALFEQDRILAFAIGKPSDAFGEPYRIFDEGRRIARLPGPPYQFLDRITEISNAEPFKMEAGGMVTSEYDTPPDAWYFAANCQGDMPFAVLLEIALQPCGWLAAYIGSALTSREDLSFRNLGGTGIQYEPVYPDTGTLAVHVKITKTSSSAGMIIQWFDFEVWAGPTAIYKGDTYFGFFPYSALARQEGIQNAKLYRPNESESTRGQALPYPADAPFAGDQLRMVEHIEAFIPDGGPLGLGYIRGAKRVNADEWFFKAHFYQDPVVPGSLGLESFLQLLKFVAIRRWGLSEGARWEAVAMNEKHEWTYRGQIVPKDKQVTVEAVVTAIDDRERRLTADGFLSVDGRVIYGMKNFTVQEQKSGMR
jgi:PfaB family protein